MKPTMYLCSLECFHAVNEAVEFFFGGVLLQLSVGREVSGEIYKHLKQNVSTDKILIRFSKQKP